MTEFKDSQGQGTGPPARRGPEQAGTRPPSAGRVDDPEAEVERFQTVQRGLCRGAGRPL